MAAIWYEPRLIRSLLHRLCRTRSSQLQIFFSPPRIARTSLDLYVPDPSPIRDVPCQKSLISTIITSATSFLPLVCRHNERRQVECFSAAQSKGVGKCQPLNNDCRSFQTSRSVSVHREAADSCLYVARDIGAEFKHIRNATKNRCGSLFSTSRSIQDWVDQEEIFVLTAAHPSAGLRNTGPVKKNAVSDVLFNWCYAPPDLDGSTVPWLH